MNGVETASRQEPSPGDCAEASVLFDGTLSAAEALLAKKMIELGTYYLHFRDAETGNYETQWMTLICSQELYRRVFAGGTSEERISKILEEIGLVWLPVPARWIVRVAREEGFCCGDEIQLAIVKSNGDHSHYLVLLAPEEPRPRDAW